MEVSGTESITPTTIMFLSENQLYLTIRNSKLAVWNLDGEIVSSFEDLFLWHPDLDTNKIYITTDEDLIISYCKDDSEDSSTEGNGNFLIHLEITIFDSVVVDIYTMVCRMQTINM